MRCSSDSNILQRDRHVADLAAGRVRDLRHRFCEAEQARAGELVELANVPVVGQRGDRDVGNVVGVDERLPDVSGGERDLALE